MAITGNSTAGMTPFDQSLAAIPNVTAPRPVNDGEQWSGTDAKPSSALAPVGQTLKGKDRVLKFKAIDGLVRSQDRLATNRYAISTYFRWVRQGNPFGRLEKIPNQSIWVARQPPGMTRESNIGVPNKADDLCNKLEDTLMSDPPKPLPEPKVSDESAHEAAELAATFLTQNGGDEGTDDVRVFRWCLNNGLTAGSSFAHYRVQQAAGGSQPYQILAHPEAQDAANPLVAMVPAGEPQIDPLTGQMGEPPMMEERAINPVMRYVSAPTPDAPAGTFVEDASQADRVWLPKVIAQTLRSENIRCFPATARVEDADAVAVIDYCTLAEGRARWPETVGQMDDTALRALAGWRPTLGEQQVVPYALRNGLADGASGPALADVGSLSPLLQRRMYFYLLYVKDSPEYAGGYVLEMNGNDSGTLLGEGSLEFEVTLPTGGKEKRCREIPVAQLTLQKDVNGGDPFGYPVLSRFAGASEASATLYAATMDYCDNMLHPHVFIEGTTAVDDEDWADRTRPIIINPQSKPPYYENFPPLPPVLPVLENLDVKMDTSSGLTATAQGLDSANSQSGVAKQATVRQAQVYLSGFNQELRSFSQRCWRLILQLVQAEYKIQQLIETTGTEGSSEAIWWTGENMAGIDRIGIAPGSGTMMTPEAKANYVSFLQGQQWLTPEAAADVALPGIRLDLGIPSDPAEEALDRSIGVWLQGPPEGWMEAFAAYQQEVAAAHQQFDANMQAMAPQVAEAQAQLQPGPDGQMPPMPEPPAFKAPPFMLPNPFEARPNDTEPQICQKVAKRLSKFMFDPKYSQQPEEWRTLVDGRYQAAIQVIQQAQAAQVAAQHPAPAQKPPSPQQA